MKTLLIALSWMVATAAGSFAQQKLWTWTAPKGEFYFVMHAAAVKKDGSAAVVLAKLSYSDPGSYLLVLVDPKGKAVTKRIPTGDSVKQLLLYEGAPLWQVAFLGDKVATAKGGELTIYTRSENGTLTGKKLDHSDVKLFGRSEFSGWIEGKGDQSTYLFMDDGEVMVKQISQLKLWKME